jgi:hypothetical protein
VASRTPVKRVGSAALELAKALVEYAEGRRAEPPANLRGVGAEELYLALRMLGRDPIEVAERARERWEALRAAPAAPAPAAPAAAGRPEAGAVELPDRVRGALLARLPEWADGAYVERARKAALAVPAPENLRRRVLWAIAEAAAEPSGGAALLKAPLKRFFEGRMELPSAMVAPSPPPEGLAPLLGVFPAGEGRVGLYYYRLNPEYVAERLTKALDRLAPEWRSLELYVPDALIDNAGFANALKHWRERLGLKGRTGAEAFREAVERLAGWEGAVALAGKGVLVEAVPVKRSKRHEGYYFNDNWQRVVAALPLEEGGDPRSWRNTVVLKTGEAYRAEAVGGGGYATFSLPPPPRKQP